MPTAAKLVAALLWGALGAGGQRLLEHPDQAPRAATVDEGVRPLGERVPQFRVGEQRTQPVGERDREG